MKNLTFADSPATDAAKAHEEKFGDVAPEGLPYQLEWPSPLPDQNGTASNCIEYGRLLADCVKRGKPVTVREYVDFFWKDESGVYRWNVTKAIETRSYDDFVRLVTAEDFDF